MQARGEKFQGVDDSQTVQFGGEKFRRVEDSLALARGEKNRKLKIARRGAADEIFG